MARIIGIIVLILSILLFPPATLALISNNAVPGDATYPIKRTLEDGILLIASLNPTTKAWFSVERSNRRFTEATTLLGKGKEASETLDELVFQTNSAADEVVNIDDSGQKDALINQLSQSIEKYDKGLKQASGVVIEQTAPLVPPPEATPMPTPTSQATAKPTTTPTVAPTTRPTVAPVPPTAGTPAQSGPSEKQKQELEEARKKLEEIRKKLEEERKKLEEERRRERQQKKEDEENKKEQQSRERENRNSQIESERKDNTRQGTKEVIIETSEKNGLKKSD